MASLANAVTSERGLGLGGDFLAGDGLLVVAGTLEDFLQPRVDVLLLRTVQDVAECEHVGHECEREAFGPFGLADFAPLVFACIRSGAASVLRPV